MRNQIVLNMAKCPKCHVIMLSLTIHDFRRCECGACFVDGGTEYLRRGGNPIEFSVIKVGKFFYHGEENDR